MALPTKLAQYLTAHDETNAAFSRRCGIRREVLGHYVNGDRRPGLENAVRIEKATGGEVPHTYWVTFVPRKPRRRAASLRRSA